MAKKKPQTPAAARVDLARARRLGIGSALIEVQEKLLRPQAEAEFIEWLTHPVTRMMIDALREISATPPVAYIDTQDVGVQYGVSSGLSFAASFFADPRVLYPHLFSGAAPGNPLPMPEADYCADMESAAANGGN